MHGYGYILYYVDETLPGGADIVATILTDVMRRLYEIFPAAKEIVVHVQADNCTENKNKVVFAVQEIMVRLAKAVGVDLRFENNYLLVNHTHEDIDQVRSPRVPPPCPRVPVHVSPFPGSIRSPLTGPPPAGVQVYRRSHPQDRHHYLRGAPRCDRASEASGGALPHADLLAVRVRVP